MKNETLRGQVSEVRILRGSWGMIRLLHGSGNETAKVTGYPLGVDAGDTIEATGRWVTNDYGREFKAKAIEVVAPSDARGAIEWIAHRLPQVGRKLATEMCARWGVPGIWEILEKHPEKLAELRGLTPKRIAAIVEQYAAHRAERDRMVRLKRYGLTDGQCARVIEVWGERALEELRRNPYALAEHVPGFGFLRSDVIAKTMGLPTNHPSRIRAGLLHVLSEARGAGHVYVAGGKLVALAARMLGLGEKCVRTEAHALIKEDKAVLRGSAVYTPELARAERSVAAAVVRLLG